MTTTFPQNLKVKITATSLTSKDTRKKSKKSTDQVPLSTNTKNA